MKKLIIGVLLGAFFWFFMFSSFPEIASQIHNHYFWYAMTFATICLSAYSLINQKEKLKTIFQINKKFILIGIAHAIILFGISRLGVFVITNFFSFASGQLQAIYATKSQASPMLIAPLLFFIIGPSEEIFWRGYVQDKFMEFFGDRKGWLITTAIYSLVHIWALNPMLMLAAIVLGLHWGFLYMKYKSIIPGLVSHAIWDTLIFVILPVTL